MSSNAGIDCALDQLDGFVLQLCDSVDFRSSAIMERLDKVHADLQLCKHRIDKLKQIHSHRQSVDDEGFIMLSVKPTFPRRHNVHHQSLPSVDLQLCTELMHNQKDFDFSQVPLNNSTPANFEYHEKPPTESQTMSVMERLAAIGDIKTKEPKPSSNPVSDNDKDLELQISKDLHELRKIMNGLSKSRLEVNEFMYRVDDASFLPPLPNVMTKKLDSNNDGNISSALFSGSQSAPMISNHVSSAIPPPPPPPPLMQPLKSSSKESLTKSSPVSADPVRNALMDAIKEAGGVTALRKAKAGKSKFTESPATPPPMSSGLKKSNSVPAPDIMSALTEALARRRQGLSEKQLQQLEQRKSNDGEDNEW